MKKIITILSLLVVATAGKAQTFQYTKVITVHHDKENRVKSTLTKMEGGTLDLDAKIISIDKEWRNPQFFDIARVGNIEQEDEGYTSVEYVCLALTKAGGLKAVRILAVYTPKKELCDLVVKNGTTFVDYCVKDK